MGEQRAAQRQRGDEDPVAPPLERIGGDAACWAHRVCPECGRLNEAEHPVVCENCGSRFD